MFLRKDQAGAAPGYTWENAGDVHEVDDHLAYQLLAIPDGGFSEAAQPEPVAEPEPTPESDDEADQDDMEEETPKRRGGRPRLPRDTDGKIIREVSETDETE